MNSEVITNEENLRGELARTIRSCLFELDRIPVDTMVRNAIRKGTNYGMDKH